MAILPLNGVPTIDVSIGNRLPVQRAVNGLIADPYVLEFQAVDVFQDQGLSACLIVMVFNATSRNGATAGAWASKTVPACYRRQIIGRVRTEQQGGAFGDMQFDIASQMNRVVAEPDAAGHASIASTIFVAIHQSSPAAAIEGCSTRTATIADITDFLENKIIVIVIIGFVVELTLNI